MEGGYGSLKESLGVSRRLYEGYLTRSLYESDMTCSTFITLTNGLVLAHGAQGKHSMMLRHVLGSGRPLVILRA